MDNENKRANMATYLLPCAFCGCTKVPVRQGNGIGDYWLECSECGASTKLREDGAGNEKDWNRRPVALAHSDAAQAPKRPYGYVLGGNYWTDDELTAKQVSVRTGSNYLPIYAAPVAPAATAPITRDAFYQALRAALKLHRRANPPRYLNDEQADASDDDFASAMADHHAQGAAQ